MIGRAVQNGRPALPNMLPVKYFHSNKAFFVSFKDLNLGIIKLWEHFGEYGHLDGLRTGVCLTVYYVYL